MACLARCVLICTLVGLAVRCSAGPLAVMPKKYLAACLLARDGNRDIREWVEYHLAIGFDMIYLLDHNSTIPMVLEVLDYVAEGKVHYTAFRSEAPRPPAIKRFAEGLQGRAFQQCFDWGRNNFVWMAFTDLDEVLVVNDPKYNFSLPALLRRYEGHGAVLGHWIRLGSGGVVERKEGQGRLETFTKCTAVRELVKGIANLRYTSLGVNAHTFTYHQGRIGIRPGDNRKVGVAHLIRPPLGSPLAVFHYSGAINEWKERVSKLGAGVSGFSGKAKSTYDRIEEESRTPCTEAAQVAARMATRRKPGCDAQSLATVAALARSAAASAVPTRAPSSRSQNGNQKRGERQG